MDQTALEQWSHDLEIAQAKKLITFESVNERAIDIAMAVLINSDGDFRQWLVSQILEDEAVGFIHFQARWGVCNEGESDLVWFLIAENQRIALMIENKINCNPQESQYDRYCKRSEYWKQAGLIDASRIILFSPRNYRSNEAHKYLRFNYETVSEWLGQPTSGMRKELAWLISQGLCKPQNVWNVGTDGELLDWFRWLWDLASKNYPGLWMIGKCSTGKGGKVSPWIERPFRRQGHSFRLMLKLGLKPRKDKEIGWGSQSYLSAIDLQINNAASRSSFLMPELRKMTAGLPLKLVPTGKSLSIRKDVPLVKDKDYDVERAMEALKAAQEIQDWFERNELSLLDLLRCSELKLAG